MAWQDVSCGGCCAQCCGYKFHTNNIDLDKIVVSTLAANSASIECLVQDVDTIAEKPACCKGIGIIIVQDGDGNHEMLVKPEFTQQISQKIQMAQEDAELRSHAVISSAPGQAY